MQIDFTSATTTSITVALNGAAAGPDGASISSYEVQYGTRFEPGNGYQYCVAPIFRIPAGASYTFAGLNRAQTYFLRVREIYQTDARGSWSAVRRASTLEGVETAVSDTIQVQSAVVVVPQIPNSWGATLTVDGFPPSNLGRPTPAAAWRGGWNGVGYNFYIETSGEPIDTIAVLDTNLPEGAMIRVAAGSTIAKASGTADADYATVPAAFRASPNLRGRRGYHGLLRLPAPINHRYVGVLIDGVRPPGDLLHVTHAVFGRGRVIKNYSELTDTPTDAGTFERLRDGSPDSVAGFRGRRADFELALMTEIQAEVAFADLHQRIGFTDPALIIPNSRPGFFLHDRLLYGVVMASRRVGSNARYNQTLSCESIVN